MPELITLWFDKDGVLAKYDYSLYEGEHGAPAPWMVRNAHVFRNLDTYSNMCSAVRRLYEETCNVSADKRICNVRVLTAVSDGVTLSEHILDGAYWCQNAVGLKPRDFYACAVAKENVPVTLRNELRRSDVLFDDYMPNLIKWKNAGGTAIKVVNEINSYTDKFPWISVHASDITLYYTLRTIVNMLCCGNDISNGGIPLMAEYSRHIAEVTANH